MKTDDANTADLEQKLAALLDECVDFIQRAEAEEAGSLELYRLAGNKLHEIKAASNKRGKFLRLAKERIGYSRSHRHRMMVIAEHWDDIKDERVQEFGRENGGREKFPMNLKGQCALWLVWNRHVGNSKVKRSRPKRERLPVESPETKTQAHTNIPADAVSAANQTIRTLLNSLAIDWNEDTGQSRPEEEPTQPERLIQLAKMAIEHKHETTIRELTAALDEEREHSRQLAEELAQLRTREMA
jgi:hypothetical protein